MKKANKMMALTMAAAMLVPQMAFAGESEQTTFNIFAGVSALSPDNSEKPLVQQMNEAMGVSIDWNCVSGDTLTEKKNLILNAGVDMPDAFMAAELSDYELINYGGYGVLIPLEDYINEETMPNLTKAMEECPELRAACTDRDGKIYSLPKKLPLRPTVCGNGLYINQDWLDNLGLEAPKTLDELTDVLLAFAKEDADGDGDPTNEIGLTNNAGTNLQADCQHILSVWGCMVSRNNNYMGLNNDGEAVFVPAQENYKEAVEWMHMLWENGVLDPEYFTQDGSSVTAKLQAEGGSKVGIISAWTADSEAGTNAKQYSLMEAVEGYNDIHYVECATASLDITDRELVITTACEDPEALLKWADNFYDDLVSLQTFYGSLGVTVTANDDGTYSVHSTDDNTSLDTAAWSNSLRDFGPKYMNPEFYDKVIIPDDVSDGTKLKEDEVNAKYVTTDKNTGMPALQYTEDELNRITAIGTDVYSYVEAMYAHWVVDGGVEDEWDSYIEQLNAMGLEEMVSLQQGAYAAYLESME